MGEKRYGHYSEQSAEVNGIVAYTGPDGKEVLCTCVCSHAAPTGECCKWGDLIHLGPMGDFVRRVTDPPRLMGRYLIQRV